ncbi:MAG: DegT/DnrJ/EryC1/StrS family aminotransferase [Promethearchaeota archaeon]|jgi:perosamine synthetase
MIYLDEADLDFCPSTRGNKVKEFERACADYLGVNDCVAVNSGTSALFLSLVACGIGPGDEVIVPACTFVGTANAVLYTGAKVRLVDICLNSWLIDFNKIQGIFNEKTKAIIGVHLYGNPSNISLSPIHLRGYPAFIFDGACSLGTKLFNTNIERYGWYTAISLNGNKTITTGGGGLIVGQDLDKIRKMLVPGCYEGLGYNMGMPAINAALGLEQLKKVDEYIEKKRRFNQIYREELDGLVTFQEATPNSNPVWWMTACLMPENIDIPELQWKLKENGVPTREVFKPLNHYPHIKDNNVYSNAEYIYKHGICLPSSVKNNEDDIYVICKNIKGLI